MGFPTWERRGSFFVIVISNYIASLEITTTDAQVLVNLRRSFGTFTFATLERKSFNIKSVNFSLQLSSKYLNIAKLKSAKRIFAKKIVIF